MIRIKIGMTLRAMRIADSIELFHPMVFAMTVGASIAGTVFVVLRAVMAKLAGFIGNGTPVISHCPQSGEGRHGGVVAEPAIVAEKIVRGGDWSGLEEPLVTDDEGADDNQEREDGSEQIEHPATLLERGRTLVVIDVNPLGDLLTSSVVRHKCSVFTFGG